MAKIKTNLLVDFIILVSFLIAFEPALTGIAIHEWFSLALAATMIVHILLHWRWVVSVTTQFVKRLLHSSRLNYLVDAAVFIAFTIVMFSGLLISESIFRTIGLQPLRDPFWRLLHARSADAALILIGVHFALHWNWIVGSLKRVVLAPFNRMGKAPVVATQTVTVEE